jgi:hypothetical protein
MSDLIRIGGLWKNETATGTVLSGNLAGDCRVVIFKNTRKEKENQPDYIMYFSPKRRDEGYGEGGSAPSSGDNGNDQMPF